MDNIECQDDITALRDFFNCECGGEGIIVERCDGNIELCFWNMGESTAQSLRQRLSWCWKILKTGKPWADQVILSQKEASRIVDSTNKKLGEISEQRQIVG